jgi:hypothetical protein
MILSGISLNLFFELYKVYGNCIFSLKVKKQFIINISAALIFKLYRRKSTAGLKLAQKNRQKLQQAFVPK